MKNFDNNSLLNNLTKGINMKSAKDKGMDIYEDEAIVDTMADIPETGVFEEDSYEEMPMYEVPVSIKGIKEMKEASQETQQKEEVAVVKTPNQKKVIQRNGNPFKRGPRKKVEPLEELKENHVEIEEEVDFLPDEEVNFVSEIIEDTDETDPFAVKVEETEDRIPFSLENLEEVEEEVEFKGFGDFEDSDDSEELEDEDSEDENSFEELAWGSDEDSEDEDFEGKEEVDFKSVVEPEEVEFKGEITFEEDTEINEEEEIEPDTGTEIETETEIIVEVPKPTTVAENEKVKSKEVQVEETNTNKVEGAIYAPGMQLLDFLRLNPNVRLEEEVQQFYSKGDIQAAITKGQVLIKKGKLRI